MNTNNESVKVAIPHGWYDAVIAMQANEEARKAHRAEFTEKTSRYGTFWALGREAIAAGFNGEQFHGIVKGIAVEAAKANVKIPKGTIDVYGGTIAAVIDKVLDGQDPLEELEVEDVTDEDPKPSFAKLREWARPATAARLHKLRKVLGKLAKVANVEELRAALGGENSAFGGGFFAAGLSVNDDGVIMRNGKSVDGKTRKSGKVKGKVPWARFYVPKAVEVTAKTESGETVTGADVAAALREVDRETAEKAVAA